jgi:hypothetical protein
MSSAQCSLEIDIPNPEISDPHAPSRYLPTVTRSIRYSKWRNDASKTYIEATDEIKVLGRRPATSLCFNAYDATWLEDSLDLRGRDEMREEQECNQTVLERNLQRNHITTRMKPRDPASFDHICRGVRGCQY